MAIMFGPDQDKVTMDFAHAYELELAPFSSYVLSFSVEAAWENAVVIQYSRHHGLLPPATVKGNMNRELNDHRIIGTNDAEHDVIFISAWHKRGGPSGALPWYQNKMRKQESKALVQLFFEDNTDEDFNDIVVSIQRYA